MFKISNIHFLILRISKFLYILGCNINDKSFFRPRILSSQTLNSLRLNYCVGTADKVINLPNPYEIDTADRITLYDQKREKIKQIEMKNPIYSKYVTRFFHKLPLDLYLLSLIKSYCLLPALAKWK